MREREVKLAAPPRFVLPDLDGVVDGVTAAPPRETAYQTVYWDTPDLRLARWGCGLRHREGEGWTVKLPAQTEGAVLVRGEHTFAGPPSRPAAPAVDLVRAYVRGDELAPVARLRARRCKVVLRAGGVQQAEVVDDEVSVYDGRRLALRFREVEVELAEAAGDDLLDAVLGRLRAAGAGATQSVAKHVRALGPRAQEPPEITVPPLHAGATLGEVARAALAASTIRLLRHDAGVRLGEDPEDVHQARVATRRLRSDLRTFGVAVDHDWATALREELGWLAHLLGDVRDADVLLERLAAMAATLQEEDQTAAASLLRRLRGQREAARERLLEALGSDRYVDLLDRLVSGAQQPVLTEAASTPAVESVGELAAGPWRALRRDVRGLPKHPPDEALHAVRIRAKRLRYAAEAVEGVASARAGELARAAARLQTVLGDHNDAVVAQAWLRTAGLASRSSAVAFVAGRLAQMEDSAARALRDGWPDAYRQLGRKRLHAWM